MKSMFLGLLSSLLFFCGVHATDSHSSEALVGAQPTSCLKGEFSSTGDNYWRTITLKITNNCSTAVDLQDAAITFQNKSALSTNFWGQFGSLSYPDNALNFTSQPDGNGTFTSSLRLHFPSYNGSNSKLDPGKSISIIYGTPKDDFIKDSVKVYLGSNDAAGSILFTNSTDRPANVVQTYALLHVMQNGQKVADVQIPWQGNKTIAGLTPAAYTITADSISDTAGNTYQATISPSIVNVAAGQDQQVNISYASAQQSGSIVIQLQALPSGLSGYTEKPVVTVTHSGGGSSVPAALNWGDSTAVNQLKNGTTYSFSTPAITYNGAQWTPAFAPDTLTAKSSGAPTTLLTYQSVPVTQNAVIINVKGAASSLASLVVSLLPNNGTAVIDTVVPLSNGAGSVSIPLPDGVSYTVSANAVQGYSMSFSHQPLVSKVNAVETITLVPVTSGTPVAMNGQLKIVGTNLCNEQGQPVQLKGVSSHGLQWYYGCLNTASLNAIANDFKASVLRISLYVQEGGYETDPEGYTAKVNQLIQAASDRGIYALVDWHILTPGDPNYNFDRARKFFTDIATANKGKKNLIYEICNEPNGVTWSTIKTYAMRLIPIIRAVDPNTVIIVGTPGWSSLGVSEGNGSQEIINTPLNFPNIMYAFHFYAVSHRDAYLNELDKASNSLPIFVTEFGTQNYEGDGANDFAMADRYMDLMARKKISWTYWNFSDDFRTGAMWKPGTCPNGPWTDANLKESGLYIKKELKE